MAKAPQPLRIGVDLGEHGLHALVMQPDGRLHPFRTALTAYGETDAAFDKLAAELYTLGLEPGPDTATAETVLVSRRSWQALTRPEPVAFLITEGFEDIFLVRGQRPTVASLFCGLKLTTLCPRERCLGVPERLGADGSVLKPLTGDALLALQKRVRELGVSAIAVVLLHSYQNDAHERTVAEALAPLELPVSISSAVARVPDERRRAGAALLDACLAPTLSRELASLRGAGFGHILCTDAAGDAVPAAQSLPLRRLLAPAAAGLRGAQRIAAANGMPRFLALGAFDRFAVVALYDPTLQPDTAPVVGPLSEPELAADVPAQALQIFEADAQDGLPALEEQLLAALFAMTLERGHDPAIYPLVCYGSVAPQLGATLAERLGAESVLMLPAPALVTAFGALCAPVVCQRRELLFVEASSAQQTGQVAATLHALADRLRADLAREGYLTSQYLPGHEWFAEMRYQGQGMGHMHALTLIGLGDGGPAVGGDTDLVVRFCIEHQRRYGFTLAECPVELVALRVRATLPVATPSYSEFTKLVADYFGAK